MNYRILERGWAYPAHEFEEKTGMSGIAGDYQMPGDMSLYEALCHFEELMRQVPDDKRVTGKFETEAKSVTPEVHAFVQDIIAINPDLARVRLNGFDPGQIQEFISGVTSGFNADDIDFFLHDWKKMWNANPANEYSNYQSALHAEIGYIGEFVMSPRTFEKIKNHFGLSDWEPTQEELREAVWKEKRIAYNEHVIKALQDQIRLKADSQLNACVTEELNNRAAQDDIDDGFIVNYKGRKFLVWPDMSAPEIAPQSP